MKLDIPTELHDIFERYRGTGRFTVGEVAEFIRRWNTMKTAQHMDLREWISYVVDVSCKNGLNGHSDMKSYMDGNIDLWIDIWRNANDGFVHFSRMNVQPFVDEGMIEVIYPGIYDYSDMVDGDDKKKIVFDLVKFKVNLGDASDEGKGQIARVDRNA